MQRDMYDGESLDRHENGVRVRRDGQGDLWSNEHREELGNAFYLNDFDAVMGYMAFAKTGAGETFAEYVPDAYANKGKVFRRFATVAIFDRKKSMASVRGILNTVQLAYYLDICRLLADKQPIAPKFFFVVGEAAPWEMVEVDVWTGELGRTWCFGKSEWKQVWNAAGLSEMRRELRRWIESPEAGIH